MKIALIAVAGSLVHTMTTKDADQRSAESHSSSAKDRTYENRSLSNLRKAEGFYYFMAPTTPNLTYQTYCSDDQQNWEPHGVPFRGNGSLYVVCFDSDFVENSQQMYVKFRTL